MPDVAASFLLEKRRSALMAKWSTGKRLTPGELEEVADLLPRPAALLALEAQVEGVSDKKYQRGREAYAATYGQSLRTINRWMKRRAPLDAPAAMAPWWSANMKHRVPGEILRLAEVKPASVPGEAGVAGPSPLPAGLDLSPVEQARELSRVAYAKLLAAQTGDDAGKLALAERSYNSASEQLRRVELAAPKIDAASGAVVSRAKVVAALARVHTSIDAALRSFCKRMRREMAGKPEPEQDAIWQAELDKLFGRFREHEFSDFAA